MLFLTYWALNEEMSVEERQQVVQKLTSSGLFPPKGVNIVRWDATPDGWGVLLAEAENTSDIARSIDMWRAARPGFFRSIKTAPALPVHEVVSRTDQLLKDLKAA